MLKIEQLDLLEQRRVSKSTKPKPNWTEVGSGFWYDYDGKKYYYISKYATWQVV